MIEETFSNKTIAPGTTTTTVSCIAEVCSGLSD